MIMAELAQLETDPLRKKAAIKNAESIWRDFIRVIRSTLQSPEYTDIVETLIAAWLYEKSGGKVGTLGESEQRNAA